MTLIILRVVVGLIVLYFVGVYNVLVMLRNRCENAFAQIDVQLTRRHDLIPHRGAPRVVSRVGEARLEAVMQARNAVISGLAGARESPGLVRLPCSNFPAAKML